MGVKGNVRITATADDLVEGLFGQVFLFVAEILPYLSARGLRPDWEIHTRLYGKVIPGALDLAYRPESAARDVALATLRKRHRARLEGDWVGISALWHDYFAVPARVTLRADALGDLSATLGVHYRGTDKLTATWDTNPVGAEDFAAIVRDWLGRRPDLRQVFVATDDAHFADYLATVIDRPIVSLGTVAFHKAEEMAGRPTPDKDALGKADRALLDCVLLSRCAAVLKTSSALSGFAKILRPDLEIYRCAASKLFSDIPYFPVAYIPPYRTDDPAVSAIIARLMAGDWSEAKAGPLPGRPAPTTLRRRIGCRCRRLRAWIRAIR